MRVITRLNVGGPAHQALALTRALDPEVFECVLVVGSLGPGEIELKGSGMATETIIRLSALRRGINPIYDLAAVFGLAWLMVRYRPDIVHTHLSKAGALGRVSALIARVPIRVHTFHGNVFQGYFSQRASALVILLERQLARISTALVAISESQRDDLISAGLRPARRIEVIPLGLDLDRFVDATGTVRSQVRRDLGIAGDAPVIGLVGRLVAIKRVDLFLRAARRIGARLPNAAFLVVGDGPLRASLEDLAVELGIREAIHFTGYRSDMRAVYEALDVVVLTSDNEGTPVVLIEALAAARPIVATDVGGVSDVVGSSRGTLVAPGDPVAVADAVVAILNSPEEAHARAQAGREFVLGRYSERALVERISSLYKRLTTGSD